MLAPYGFFWLQLIERETSPIEVPRTPAEFETLVLAQGWRSLQRTTSLETALGQLFQKSVQ
jgi:hypothetical protein